MRIRTLIFSPLLFVGLTACDSIRKALVPADFVRSQFFEGTRCSEIENDEMIKVGNFCIDKFEASVWSDKDGMDHQYGLNVDDYPCHDNGADCFGKKSVYAVSKSGAVPSTRLTWFQAQRACANSGKRLPTNTEWQLAALGTPNSSVGVGEKSCSTTNENLSGTGKHDKCVSSSGIYDMAGNVREWVADWLQANSDNDGVSFRTYAEYGNDAFLGVDEAHPESARMPAAIVRGGDRDDGVEAGPYAFSALFSPAYSHRLLGFRCAK